MSKHFSNPESYINEPSIEPGDFGLTFHSNITHNHLTSNGEYQTQFIEDVACEL